MSTICNAVFRNGKLVEASASEFDFTLHLLPYYSNADHFTQERVEVLTIAEVSALRQNVAELARENEALKSKVGFYESVSPQDIVDEANRPEPVALKEQSNVPR